MRDVKIQRRDGNESVARKVNLLPFSLYGDYSYPLTLSNVDEPCEVEFQATISKSRFRRYLFTFSIKREIRLFHVVVVQKWQEMYKSVMHVRSCCFGN